MKIVKLKKIATGTTGSEIAEAALVLPIFFLIMLGIYWFGRAFNTYATINHAAREGARLAVAQTCAACGNARPSLTAIGTQVYYNVQLQPAASLSAGSGAPGCGVSVQFQYPYQFYLPFTSLNMQQVTLNAGVQMSAEY